MTPPIPTAHEPPKPQSRVLPQVKPRILPPVKPPRIIVEHFDIATYKVDQANGYVEADCQHCGATIKGQKNVTSNFIQHMRRRHPQAYDRFAANSTHRAKRPRLSTGSTSTVTPPKTSAIPYHHAHPTQSNATTPSIVQPIMNATVNPHPVTPQPTSSIVTSTPQSPPNPVAYMTRMPRAAVVAAHVASRVDMALETALVSATYRAAKRTDCVSASRLSIRTACHVYLKREDQQVGGGVLFRAAYNYLAATPTSRAGLVAPGPDALPIAKAAEEHSKPILIVVPETLPDLEIQRLSQCGAKCLRQGRTDAEALVAANEHATKMNRTLVYLSGPKAQPGCSDAIAGYATLALELLQQCPHASRVYLPAGNALLFAGVTSVLSRLGRGVKLIGVVLEDDPHNRFTAKLTNETRTNMPTPASSPPGSAALHAAASVQSALHSSAVAVVTSLAAPITTPLPAPTAVTTSPPPTQSHDLQRLETETRSMTVCAVAKPTETELPTSIPFSTAASTTVAAASAAATAALQEQANHQVSSPTPIPSPQQQVQQQQQDEEAIQPRWEAYASEIVSVTTSQMCAAVKAVFEDCGSILEPYGALSVAGAVKQAAVHHLAHERLVCVVQTPLKSFDTLRMVTDEGAVAEGGGECLLTVRPREGAREGLSGLMRSIRASGPTVSRVTTLRYSGGWPLLLGLACGGFNGKIDPTSSRIISNITEHGYETRDISKEAVRSMGEFAMPPMSQTIPSNSVRAAMRVEIVECSDSVAEFLSSTWERATITHVAFRSNGSGMARLTIIVTAASTADLLVFEDDVKSRAKKVSRLPDRVGGINILTPSRSTWSVMNTGPTPSTRATEQAGGDTENKASNELTAEPNTETPGDTGVETNVEGGIDSLAENSVKEAMTNGNTRTGINNNTTRQTSTEMDVVEPGGDLGLLEEGEHIEEVRPEGMEDVAVGVTGGDLHEEEGIESGRPDDMTEQEADAVAEEVAAAVAAGDNGDNGSKDQVEGDEMEVDDEGEEVGDENSTKDVVQEQAVSAAAAAQAAIAEAAAAVDGSMAMVQDPEGGDDQDS